MHTSPSPTRGPSKGLVALNLALLLGLGLAVAVPSAIASRQPNRARGVYAMVNGAVMGGNSDAIYIVDSANQEMVVVR